MSREVLLRFPVDLPEELKDEKCFKKRERDDSLRAFAKERYITRESY